MSDLHSRPTGEPAPEGTVLPKGQRRERAYLHEIQEVIDGLVEQVALVSCDGIILAVNDHWRRQVERQARTGLHISRDYVAFLKGLIESGDDGVRPILRAFLDISGGSRQTFRCVYYGRGVFSGYDFNVIIAALTINRRRHVLVSVHDATELVKLKRQRRRIGRQLLDAQEAERRQIARELHDSTSQLIVALDLDLGRLARMKAGPEVDAVVAECKKTVAELHREVRAISFIAHPPILKPHSLETALRSLASGFASRTGLDILVDISALGDASPSVEVAIYRIFQEALTNIHRHAQAKHVRVRLEGRMRYIHLRIEDDGVGFDPGGSSGELMGVGVPGMAERVRELGGRLSVGTAPNGTVLTASLPRQKRMKSAPL